MSLTTAQQQAVKSSGNVLLVAGAGTGKTSTLVARCLHCLLDEKPPATLDEILMVTFTEAAALEMRQRLREALERIIQEKLKAGKRRSSDSELGRLEEQLALFDAAHIGTLHSFCLKLVRQHFYELELDPQLTVIPEEEARLLADETLNDILEKHYTSPDSAPEAVQQLIRAQGRDGDGLIRALVLRLHHYTQTLHDPDGWFSKQSTMFRAAEPTVWTGWLRDALRSWRDQWLPALQNADGDNINAAQGLAQLVRLPEKPEIAEWSPALEEIRRLGREFPSRRKTAWRKPFEDFYDDAEFLAALAGPDGRALAEDWNWVRGQMAALLELTREFTAAFSGAKRELGMVDFHDLEQHALTLLWDRKADQPTSTAIEWRERLRFVFVDEYQDINDAQDAILRALSRDGDTANRFLVGDVKQSIYRFRLADPRIFQSYIDQWSDEEGSAIPLVENFRSRESILDFVNDLFAPIMRRELGGVPYDETAKLQFGAAGERNALSRGHTAAPCVELHLRLKGSNAGAPAGEAVENIPVQTGLQNLEEAAKEARMAALRLLELKESGHEVWDQELKAMRAMRWADAALLLRSPSGKAEFYAREFSRLGMPLTVARGGFYQSIEINDLLNLLRLLDNPLQDIPLIAVLHSPLVGLSPDDLASIRTEDRAADFLSALRRFAAASGESKGRSRARRFLKDFTAWRRMARQTSISQCLETVLNETHYAAWLTTQSRGAQREANVRRLVALAREFDQFQRQSLSRFLRFVEAQQAAETEPDVAPAAGDDSVQLMSIHQSKGLEFPVVVLADLGKPFNLGDLNSEIILDAEYGLCPQIKPPHAGGRYPSLPYWLARRRQHQELLGEELRLLYVAVTRARDTLILTGCVSTNKFAGLWRETSRLDTASLLRANNFLDWIAAWSARDGGSFISPPRGQNSLLRWMIYDDEDPRLLDETAGAAAMREKLPAKNSETAAIKKIHDNLAWRYEHDAAARIPAKTSVSALRKQRAGENDDEAAPALRFQGRPELKRPGTPVRLSASEIGAAHHLFLQWVALDRVESQSDLKTEAARLTRENLLTAAQAASLDLAAIESFWRSDCGLMIREAAARIHRELPFTARFSPAELEALGVMSGGGVRDDFVVVQGVADLAVILPEEIWIVDFKTDRVTESELAEKTKTYEPQLRLYALALSRIYGRPVTRLLLHFLDLRRTVTLAGA